MERNSVPLTRLVHDALVHMVRLTIPAYRHLLRQVAEESHRLHLPTVNIQPPRINSPEMPELEPIVPNVSGSEIELCTICNSNQLAVELNCGHRFCGYCPAHWQAARGGRLICPLCRRSCNSQYLLPGADPTNILPLMPERDDIQNVTEMWDAEIWDTEPQPPRDPIPELNFLLEESRWEHSDDPEVVICIFCRSLVRNTTFRRQRHHGRCVYTLNRN